MEVNGWKLFQHPLFQHQFLKLLQQSEWIKAHRTDDYQHHKTVKLLAKITDLISKEIPDNPGHERFNQEDTLGTQFRHWKRAKFGRYRLFFRYQKKTKGDGSAEKAIVYAWINDDDTLLKSGDRNDPYALFAAGLKRGKPPDSFDSLLRESKEDLATGNRTRTKADLQQPTDDPW